MNARNCVAQHMSPLRLGICRSHLRRTTPRYDVWVTCRVKLTHHIDGRSSIRRGVSAASEPRKRCPHKRKSCAHQATADSFERHLCRNLQGGGEVH